MREITTIEDGTIVTVGDNFDEGQVHEPLAQSIVYLELTERSDWGDSVTAGLTRDEAMDLVDGILAVLEGYGVAPGA